MNSPVPPENFNAKGLLVTGSALAATALLLMSGITWFLVEAHKQYNTVLEGQYPLLIQDTSVSAFYLGNLAFIGLLIISVFFICVGLRGRRYAEATNKRVTKIATYLLVAGLIGVFLGRPVVNWYWADTFRDAGYSKCAGSSVITQQWFSVVWTQNPSLCEDPEVRRMIASYKYRLPEINEYVQKQDHN